MTQKKIDELMIELEGMRSYQIYISKRDRGLSYDRVAEAFNIAKSTAHYQIKRMSEIERKIKNVIGMVA